MKKKASLILAASFLAAPLSHAAYVLTNGNFEDTTGTFPNGWTTTGSVGNGGGFVPGSTADATMQSGATLGQDFSGGTSTATAENYNFQLDFAFRTSSLTIDTNQRIRLRDHNNSGDIITLGFENNATGGGVALSYYIGATLSWQTAHDVAFATGTTYYFRVNGSNLDQAGRSYTIGYSTDGTNFTTTAPITTFHGGSGDFETITFDAGTAVTRIDGVSVIPEPSTVLLGALGMLALLRRRR